MKIAYVLGEYPSVTETFIAREIEALRRRGFEIDVWALQAGERAQQIPRLSTAQCLVKPFTRVSRSAHAKYYHHSGAHWVQSRNAQLKGVQHIHAGWASFPAFIAWGAAEVLGVPWSFSGHSRDLWVESEALREKLRAAKFAACCTKAGTEYLKNLAADTGRKVLYAPHGIEISRYEFHQRRTFHEPVRLLAVGRLVQKKGFPVLLSAVAQLLDRKYSVHATIIGDGPQRNELQQQIARIQNAQVKLTGACAQEQVIAAMQSADVFVMPSTLAADGDRDGLPNVLLEAAACGLPIVSTTAGSITDFLDESCGWLCEPNDVTALTNAIEGATINYDVSLRRAKVARSRVEEKFNIEKNIEVLAEAFMASA